MSKMPQVSELPIEVDRDLVNLAKSMKDAGPLSAFAVSKIFSVVVSATEENTSIGESSPIKKTDYKNSVLKSRSKRDRIISVEESLNLSSSVETLYNTPVVSFNDLSYLKQSHTAAPQPYSITQKPAAKKFRKNKTDAIITGSELKNLSCPEMTWNIKNISSFKDLKFYFKIPTATNSYNGILMIERNDELYFISDDKKLYYVNNNNILVKSKDEFLW